MKTFDLTDKELNAAILLTKSCFTAMGGNRPSDLAKDEYTWVSIGDLTRLAFSRHQAAGFFSSLLEKGFLDQDKDDAQNGRATVWITTEGWQWIDTIWDANATTASQNAKKVIA